MSFWNELELPIKIGMVVVAVLYLCFVIYVCFFIKMKCNHCDQLSEFKLNGFNVCRVCASDTDEKEGK